MERLALLALLLLGAGMVVSAPARRQGTRLAGGAVTWTIRTAVRVTWWAIKLPLRSLWGLTKTSIALLGEEAKRWIGLLTGGALLTALSWGAFKAFAWAPPVVLTVLLIDLVFVSTLFRAAHKTASNRVSSVRTREMYKRLEAMTAEWPNQLRAIQTAAQASGRTLGKIRRDEPAPPDDPDVRAQLRWQKEQEAAAADEWGPTAGFEPVIWRPRWMRRRRRSQ